VSGKKKKVTDLVYSCPFIEKLESCGGLWRKSGGVRGRRVSGGILSLVIK
jgi:hypothetical protein